jgi:pimeloyl-ACP methyl ester carboxylesterase
VLAGLSGWVTVAVATADQEAALVALRLDPAQAAAEHPWVLFVPGAPAHDARWSRPTSPAALPPQWLADVLSRAEFDSSGRWQLAVLESPGQVRSSAGAVAAVVRVLEELLALDERAILVGEREGATAVLRAATAEPKLAAALVLVAGGALDPSTAPALAPLPVLAVLAQGHPANFNLERAVALLRAAGGAPELIPQAQMPWPIALPLALPAIEQLAARGGSPEPSAERAPPTAR